MKLLCVKCAVAPLLFMVIFAALNGNNIVKADDDELDLSSETLVLDLEDGAMADENTLARLDADENDDLDDDPDDDPSSKVAAPSFEKYPVVGIVPEPDAFEPCFLLLVLVLLLLIMSTIFSCCWTCWTWTSLSCLFDIFFIAAIFGEAGGSNTLIGYFLILLLLYSSPTGSVLNG